MLVVQVVLGLQQRCRVDRVRTREGDLRAVVDDLRRRQVTCLDDYVGAATARPLRVGAAPVQSSLVIVPVPTAFLNV